METPPDARGSGSASPSARGSALERVRCPRCAAPIDARAPAIACSRCGEGYPRLGAIPVLVAEPSAYLAACRAQLVALGGKVARTVQDIREQMGAAVVLPSTRARCRAMIDAMEGQLSDVRAILEPRLPRAPGSPSDRPHPSVPATLEYLPYLYRDWGWPDEPDGENERALAAVESVLGGEPPGRTLVLGAGACRLAYDVHRAHPESELLVLDLDPLLFSAAHAVVHGESPGLREANLEIGELEQGCRRWVLSAPEGPVDDERFHFILADAVDPPLAPGSFDTVLTPWFIDQGPEDVRDLLSTLHLVLRPGGRWVNLGPLRYDWDVPVSLRFAREEIFDLAARAGFRIEAWESGAAPYLVSKLNGRGRTEWVLAFAATRLEPPAAGAAPGGGPPAWLLFRHLPIPTFPGQSMFWSKVPAVRTVVSSIDGVRALDDIARLVAEQAGRPDLTPGQVRTAVRQCLAEVHPGCRAGCRADGSG